MSSQPLKMYAVPHPESMKIKSPKIRVGQLWFTRRQQHFYLVLEEVDDKFRQDLGPWFRVLTDDGNIMEVNEAYLVTYICTVGKGEVINDSSSSSP